MAYHLWFLVPYLTRLLVFIILKKAHSVIVLRESTRRVLLFSTLICPYVNLNTLSSTYQDSHLQTRINFLTKEQFHSYELLKNISKYFQVLKNLLNICRSDAQKYEVSSMCCRSRPGVQISIFMWWILSDSSFRS